MITPLTMIRMKNNPAEVVPGHGGQIGFGCVLHTAWQRWCMADHEVCEKTG